MENVRYKHAVSYFVIIAEIETIDDSVERKQNLTSTYQQLYCLFSVCYRMQFLEIDFRFCFVHIVFWHYYPMPYVMTCLLLKAQIMVNVIVLVETWPNNIQ